MVLPWPVLTALACIPYPTCYTAIADTSKKPTIKRSSVRKNLSLRSPSNNRLLKIGRMATC